VMWACVCLRGVGGYCCGVFVLGKGDERTNKFGLLVSWMCGRVKLVSSAIRIGIFLHLNLARVSFVTDFSVVREVQGSIAVLDLC
jgi:hypothetical protein